MTIAKTVRKTRILLVDDHVDSSVQLQENLQSLGFIVDVAHCSEAANPALTTGEYAIIIYASLPTICGSKRKRNATPSIVVRRFQSTMSTLASELSEFNTPSWTNGIADILEQPVSKDALYESICSLSVIVDTSHPCDVKNCNTFTCCHGWL